jgi:hypothetical protein
MEKEEKNTKTEETPIFTAIKKQRDEKGISIHISQ